MAEKIIVWSTHTERELKKILKFYNRRNQSTMYSQKLLTELNDILKKLSVNPHLGKLSDDPKTRVLVFGVFLIFYEINNSEIQILSFWDNRQDPEKRIDLKG